MLWGFLFSIVIAIPAFLIDGYVITKLWHWFIVAHFGVANLPLSIAIGLSILISFVTGTYAEYTTTKEKAQFRNWCFFYFARPVFILLTGYIVSLWV